MIALFVSSVEVTDTTDQWEITWAWSCITIRDIQWLSDRPELDFPDCRELMVVSEVLAVPVMLCTYINKF